MGAPEPQSLLASWLRSALVDPWRSKLDEFRRQVRLKGLRWLLWQLALSALALWLIWSLALRAGGWILYGARWEAVSANLSLFAMGAYSRSLAWRPATALVLLCAMVGLSSGVWGAMMRDFLRLLLGLLLGLLLLPLFSFVPALLGSPELAGLAAAFAPARPWLLAALAALLGSAFVGQRLSASGKIAAPRLNGLLRLLWLASIPGIALILDASSGSTQAGFTTGWGGLLLTLVLAAASIGLSFPIGVLLALGRRSRLPLVRLVCVAFIELIRGVPLVTLLYMASVLLPLVLPDGLRPVDVVRAMAGLTAFAAAYVAEDVRGGLASVGNGQFEAAKALGLGSASTYRHIVLPQALRAVIPAVVGQFISLFKDTSLAIVIGLRELVGIARTVPNQPEFIGSYRETLVFIALIYFVFSLAMSNASRGLESRLGERAG